VQHALRAPDQLIATLSVPAPRGLAFMFASIEGLSLGEIATRVLHEVGLGLLAAKAVSPASERRIDGAIRLYVLMIGKTPGTHIAELGQSPHKPWWQVQARVQPQVRI
jgi:hypothetical protein